MIQLDRVTFGYHKKNLLFQDLSLSLEAGHIYGLLGKNGAGKSSFLRNITGLLFPNSGNITVNSFEPKQRQPAFLQDIFFIPEEIYLPSITVHRYLELMAPFYPKFNEQQFWSYIQSFDIPEGNKMNNMSFGQKKKVLIAFALAANTKVLIMDEPTNGLDIPSKSQFRKIVSKALEPHQLFVISTHQVRDLENLIDNVIILENNKILLNEGVNMLSERLHFGTSATLEQSDDLLYFEQGIRGFQTVSINTSGVESKVDLEHLFNAAINAPEKMKYIFQKELQA